jgi:hypothetical protein
MFRRLLMALLFVVALASLVHDVQASSCRRRVVDYLFGGYGGGLFGYGGGSSYAGYTPPPVYTECGCRIR